MKRTSLTLSILLILFAGCSKHEAMLWVNTFGLTIVIAIGFYGLIYLIDVFINLYIFIYEILLIHFNNHFKEK